MENEQLLEPAEVAAWLDIELDWVHGAIADGLPVLGHRSDGTPILVAADVRVWLRQRNAADDTT